MRLVGICHQKNIFRETFPQILNPTFRTDRISRETSNYNLLDIIIVLPIMVVAVAAGCLASISTSSCIILLATAMNGRACDETIHILIQWAPVPITFICVPLVVSSTASWFSCGGINTLFEI